MAKWSKTRFPGVRYWESDTRKHSGKPDRCYVIRYKRHGKTITETVGWGSSGVTQQFASNIRGEIIQNIRAGEGFQSLKEKRELEATRIEAKAREKEARAKENILFRALAQKYVEWSKSEKKTWWVDEAACRNYLVSEIGAIPAKDIGVLTLQRLKRVLQKKNLSEATVKMYLSLVGQIFNKAIAWGLFNGENPVKEALRSNRKFLRVTDNRRLRTLSYEDADILLTELKDRSPQLHDLSLLSLYTGMRAGECFGLTGADIDLSNKIITIRDPKNDETRQAYMTPVVEKMFKAKIKKCSSPSEPVFKNRAGGKINAISDLFSRIIEELGFNNGVTDPRHKLVFHSLRHTHASWLAIQGTPLLTIKELLGHKRIEMTMRYAHLIPDQKREAVLKLAKIQKNKAKAL
jgi:integrase